MIDVDRLISEDGLRITTFPNGYTITWRLLNTREHQVFARLLKGGVMSPFQVYSEVFKRVSGLTLEGNIPAGIELSIGQYCMWLSGDCENETVIEDIARERANYRGSSIPEYMKRTILIAFPSKDYKEFAKQNREEILKEFTLAEAILKDRMPESFQGLDLKKIKKAGQKQYVDWEKDAREISRNVGNVERDTMLSAKELEQMRRKEGG